MNKGMLLLIEKHTDAPIEQTKTKPQETLEFNLKKQMEIISINPSEKFSKGRKWLLAVTFFEATNCIFKIIDENNSFSIGKTGDWRMPNYLPDGIFVETKNLIELRSQNDIELQVKEVKSGGTRKKIENRMYNLAGFDIIKS